MRGCGKTQLAAALAEKYEDKNWSLIAWVNAVSSDSIKSSLVELAKKLKIDTSDQPTPETIIRRCFDQLKSEDPSDRLIIFDNVENIDDLRGLVPRGNGLRVVATTTNNTGWEHQGWDTIKVGVFHRDESINYLLTATESTDRDRSMYGDRGHTREPGGWHEAGCSTHLGCACAACGVWRAHTMARPHQ